MNLLSKSFQLIYTLTFIIFILLYPVNSASFAKSDNWQQVASTEDRRQFIDTETIIYDSKGILSVFTRYSDINAEGNINLPSNSYLIKIDCQRRLYKQTNSNDKQSQAGKWLDSKDNKLIKQTIINSCTY